MLKVSKQQIFQRWDTLPDILKEALFSQYNADTLWRICEAQHLPEGKISTVALISGDVIFGFISSDDLAQEIRDSAGLNQEIAKNIAMEIDRKIFAPIRLDLEKVYAPAEISEGLAAMPNAEEVLDLRKPEMPFGTAVGIPQVEPMVGVEAPKIIGMEEKPIVPPAAGVPMAAPESQLVSPSALFGGGEAEPVIIHKEIELRPLSESRKSLGGLFGFFKKKEGMPESVRAQVEIGNQTFKTEPSAPKMARTEPAKIRVVHYTEVPETIGPFPMADGRAEAQPPENLAAVSEVEPILASQPEPEPITAAPVESPAIITPPEETEIKPDVISRPEPVIVRPEVSRTEIPAKPILDLRKTPPEIKPTAEKLQVEFPEPIPEKPEEQVVDLGMFK